jgi:hypothetical protein
LLSALRWAVMGVRCASLVPLSGHGNCYAGLLAWSDVLVVTADSISMVSEAASTARVMRCAACCCPAPLTLLFLACIRAQASSSWQPTALVASCAAFSTRWWRRALRSRGHAAHRF